MVLQSSFTVFDTETTGLSPEKGDRIVEIAGVRIEKGILQRECSFHSLVNPECSLSWEVRNIHNISDADLKDAPTIGETLPDFLAFTEGSFLVAHNAEFDCAFLRAEKESCWGFMDFPECFCTLQLSRALFPQEIRHNLDALCTRLGIEFEGDRHRALPDVFATAQAFLKMLEIGHIQSLEELRAKAGMRLPAKAR